MWSGSSELTSCIGAHGQATALHPAWDGVGAGDIAQHVRPLKRVRALSESVICFFLSLSLEKLLGSGKSSRQAAPFSSKSQNVSGDTGNRVSPNRLQST